MLPPGRPSTLWRGLGGRASVSGGRQSILYALNAAGWSQLSMVVKKLVCMNASKLLFHPWLLHISKLFFTHPWLLHICMNAQCMKSPMQLESNTVFSTTLCVSDARTLRVMQNFAGNYWTTTMSSGETVSSTGKLEQGAWWSVTYYVASLIRMINQSCFSQHGHCGDVQRERFMNWINELWLCIQISKNNAFCLQVFSVTVLTNKQGSFFNLLFPFLFG